MAALPQERTSLGRPGMSAKDQTRKSPVHSSSSCRQFIEHRLCIFQIERVGAFSEPAVNRSQQFVSLLRLALIVPEPRHAHCRAQLPGFGLLLTRNRERTLEVYLRLRRVRLGRQERELARYSMDIRLTPPF